MKNLKAFLAANRSDSGIWSADVALRSKMSLAEAASQLSKVLGIRMIHSDNFDEFDACVGSLHDHDVTLLIEREEADKGEFQIMLGPGHMCMAEGASLDLTTQMTVWLKTKAPQIGEFSEIGRA